MKVQSLQRKGVNHVFDFMNQGSESPDLVVIGIGTYPGLQLVGTWLNEIAPIDA